MFLLTVLDFSVDFIMFFANIFLLLGYVHYT